MTSSNGGSVQVETCPEELEQHFMVNVDHFLTGGWDIFVSDSEAKLFIEVNTAYETDFIIMRDTRLSPENRANRITKTGKFNEVVMKQYTNILMQEALDAIQEARDLNEARGDY